MFGGKIPWFIKQINRQLCFCLERVISSIAREKIPSAGTPCFVFGPVFSSYFERGTGFCSSFVFCYNLCMYLFIWVLYFMFIGSAESILA